ncbi:MAG: phosphoribosylformylglycinamidine cyclo-ligase [Candidatus Omnitrophota bacterium]|nr:phosphoribosylformylglycinamidine cyclo-ligase [Candidatus Omnitrophota bacterium]
MQSKYKESGVDIDAAKDLVSGIKQLAKTTLIPGVLGEIGLFSGSFALPIFQYQEPVLVSGTDGVGTKILLAETMSKYDTIGIDLVAMSVNDILTCGAQPIFFLDYLALGRIKKLRDLEIMKGIAEGCRQAGCALLGGETAQMADVYGKNGFDLAGFAVGVVEKTRMIDGSKIKAGDAILGLPSSGLHSNGFSLVRKLFPKAEIEKKGSLGLLLLTPTRIYVRLILEIIQKFEVKGLAHITGGGLLENIPRVLPKGTKAVLNRSAWQMPDVFSMIQERSKLLGDEMARTFNLGIGMIIVAEPSEAEKIGRFLTGKKENYCRIGEIEKTTAKPFCEIR